MKMTRQIAYSAGLDAANRAMRAGGRQSWNDEDYQIAIDELNRLWPLCSHKCEPGKCWQCNVPSKP